MAESSVDTGPVTVRLSRQFTASPERLFQEWFRPELFATFLQADVTTTVPQAYFEAHVGGHFRVAVRRGDASVELRGEYLEIARPERLVFAMRESSHGRLVDCVTIELAAIGRGCLLVLLHEMELRRAADRARVHEAWTAVLHSLAQLASAPVPPQVTTSSTPARQDRAALVAGAMLRVRAAD